MAEIIRAASVSPCTNLPPDPNRLPPLSLGENVAAGDACYVRTSDGKIMRSIGTALNAAAVIDGYAPSAGLVAQRQTVSLYKGVLFNYGTTLSPGAFLYLSATVAGGLSDVATTGGPSPCARVIDPQRVLLLTSY